MSQTAAELKNEIQKGMDLMRTLRDEIRVKLHLANMDAKDEWQKMEPQLAEIERTANDFSQATRTAVTNAVKQLSNLRSSLI